MADEVSVTVGIPTRNNADTIEETLRVLVEQTRPPDRVVVVDASTDETPAIVEEVAAGSDVPIDCYEQSDRGRGVGAARQDIYEHFDADLLACLDTNRRVPDDWLERRVEFHRDNEYDVLSSTPLPDWDGPVEDPRRGFFLQQANCTVTRAALDRVDGWDPWFPRGEDWDMQIRLWRSGATAYARSDLHGEAIVESEGNALGKAMSRPSSVAFLRKYGPWYARFHPEHPAGDAASVCSLVALLAAPLLLAVSPLAAALALALVGALAFAFVYMKNVRHRAGFDVRPGDAADVARFFLHGYTALRELRAGDFPWNHGGLDREAAD